LYGAAATATNLLRQLYGVVADGLLLLLVFFISLVVLAAKNTNNNKCCAGGPICVTVVAFWQSFANKAPTATQIAQ
jgi:hypothetical protein